MIVKAYTLKLPDAKARALKHIAVEEDRTVKAILEELIDTYIEAHHETLNLLSIPGLYQKLRQSSQMAHKGVRGKKLDEMDG